MHPRAVQAARGAHRGRDPAPGTRARGALPLVDAGPACLARPVHVRRAALQHRNTAVLNLRGMAFFERRVRTIMLDGST